MSTLRTLSTQTLWQVLGKLITSLATLIILGAVARVYGPSGTGVFTLALTYLAFFYLAADFGFNAYLLPRILEDTSPTTFRKILGLRILWSVVLIFISLLILPILPISENKDLFHLSVIFGMGAIVGNSLFNTANLIFQAKLRYDISVISNSVIAILTLLGFLYLIYIKVELPVLVLLHSLGWLLVGLVTIFQVRKLILAISPLFDWEFIKESFKGVWPIALTLVLNVVYFRVDAFILSSTRTLAEVGVYNLAYQVFQSALVLPTFIMNGYYPIMLRHLNADRALFIRNIQKTFGGMLIVAVLGTTLTWVLSPLLINVIASEAGFNGSVESLKILSLSFPAYFLSAILMWTLVSLRKYKTMVIIYLVGLVFNITANLIFIPQGSFIAASWITGLSEYLILTLQLAILAPLLLKR